MNRLILTHFMGKSTILGFISDVLNLIYTHGLDIPPTEDSWFLSGCYRNPNYIRRSWSVNYSYNTLALFSVEMWRVPHSGMISIPR